jgi:type II pantothenate kinase
MQTLQAAPPRPQAAPQEAHLPLPVLRDLHSYDPCTFDVEADGIDQPNGSTGKEVTLREWIDVFRHSTPTFCRHIADDAGAAASLPNPAARTEAAAQFAARFPRLLDTVLEARRAGKVECEGIGASNECGIDRSQGRVTCISLCHLRDAVLSQLGLRDIFVGVKRSENEAALALLPGVLTGLDASFASSSSLELAVRGVLAGNVFDLGAAASADLFARGEGGGADAFFRTRDERLLPRPWCVDDLDALVDALAGGGGPQGEQEQEEEKQEEEEKQRQEQQRRRRPYRKAVLFVDNAGSDVLLGLIPLARELLRAGVPEVVLAANTHPTLNDVTAEELKPLLRQAAALDPDQGLLPAALREGRLRVVASGNGLPVIDLRRCSPELVAECSGFGGGGGGGGAGDDDDDGDGLLLVLEGMGRSIETNLRATFTCDCLRIGVIKHPEVARCLGGRLYDPVVRFTREKRA